MASEFRNLIVALASSGVDFLREGHRNLAARWPHGSVNGSLAASGSECDDIGKWMDIPRPMNGVAPMNDATYLKTLLQDPFTYHRAKGTQRGLIQAVQALGYTDVEYLDWFELLDAPTWIPPGATTPVVNQNAFGLKAKNFPVVRWTRGDAIPAGSVGDQLRRLIEVVHDSKRASSRFWQLRTIDSKVVTQSWWEGGQDLASVDYVRPQWGGAGDYVVTES